MTINDIYHHLRERGLVASLRRFSRDFLGRAENYAADTGLAPMLFTLRAGLRR